MDRNQAIVAVPEEVQDEKSQLHLRLQYLIKQSGVYVSLIAEKLQRQQSEQKAALHKSTAAQGTSKPDKRPRGTRLEHQSASPSGENSGHRKPRAKNKAKISDYFSADGFGNQQSAAGALAAAAKGNKGIKLGQQDDLRPAQQPRLITGGIMKDYQLEGLFWLVSLYENGLNGILADEMGLGKTLQTISFLAFLKEKGIWGPFLIAAPVSTLANWVDEIGRFAPGMSTIMYHGTPQERARIRQQHLSSLGPHFPIVCTSYDIVMRDRKHLQGFKWKYIIIDEGHRIKNLECKLIKELKLYTSANRLLLTGTPLQNNLAELWSLLNFLLPEIFDDLYFFQEYFDFSKLQGKDRDEHQEFLETEKESALVGSLHALLKPFLLRRVKKDVVTDLPPKKEYILYAPLTPIQRELYGKLLEHDARNWIVQRILSVIPNSNSADKKRKLSVSAPSAPSKRQKEKELRGGRLHRFKNPTCYRELDDDEYFSKLDLSSSSDAESEVSSNQEELSISRALKQAGNKKLQNLLIQLRQACNSPHLFYWPWDEAKGEKPDLSLVQESGKMMVLERLVPAIIKRGHKILLFSQFSSMLDIIEAWAADIHRWNVCRIDGSISQESRRDQIAKFSTDSSYKLFLLSTRAGGLGINLTASDTVILFDSDWNPQVDLQAQDRAHRIGQKKPVVVYRLTTASTVEQTLLEKADGKRRLEKLIIQKGNFKSLQSNHNGGPSARSTNDELNELLLKEDFEKVVVVENGQQVLSDEELTTLLDRSPEAFNSSKHSDIETKGIVKIA